MNLNQRRLTGTRYPADPKPTKADVVDVLADKGFELISEKENVGEWNESRNYYAVKGDSKLLLFTKMKNERMNWAEVLDETKTLS